MHYFVAILNWLYDQSRVGGLAGAPNEILGRQTFHRDCGHKTSVSLEDAFWDELKNIAHVQRVTLSELVAKIDGTRTESNLSSAIRQFVLEHFRDKKKRADEADAQHATLSDYATSGVE